VTSPVQRRRAIRQRHNSGILLLVTGALLGVLWGVQVAVDPERWLGWLGCFTSLTMIISGTINFKVSRRDLEKLERELGVGAGSDEEIRRRHGL